MFKKLKKIKVFFTILIIFLFFVFLFSQGQVYSKDELEYGVTFSKKQARELDLHWRKIYQQMFNDLGVKKIRLSAYWNEIELSDNVWSWQDLDWQVEQAGKHKAQIILAVGGRLPRWPECHFPTWAAQLTAKQRQAKILEYIEKVVRRYRNNRQIIAWQVENEPFLAHFGDCPKLDKKFLDQEIALVKQLDCRPVIVTDSGELSLWIPAAKQADIFGTTMYLDTYSENLKMYVHYPITPGFFHFKKNIASLFASPQDWIVIELQAEPWGPISYKYLDKEEREKTMSLKKFKEILDFSRKAGFKEFYLWGVEYWYWEKTVNNDDSFWNEARKLF